MHSKFLKWVLNGPRTEFILSSDKTPVYLYGGQMVRLESVCCDSVSCEVAEDGADAVRLEGRQEVALSVH